LNSLRKKKNKNDDIPRKKFLLLLTDGQPVSTPKDGEDGALKSYFKKYPDFKCQVNTFGFGYALKSILLLNIAKVGGGAFSFIPDAKILGTNFVNAIANYATTLSQHAKLHLTPLGKSTFGDIPFDKKTKISSNGYTIELDNLQFGQKKRYLCSNEHLFY